MVGGDLSPSIERMGMNLDLSKAFARALARISLGPMIGPGPSSQFAHSPDGRRKRAKARKVERQNRKKGRAGL